MTVPDSQKDSFWHVRSREASLLLLSMSVLMETGNGILPRISATTVEISCFIFSLGAQDVFFSTVDGALTTEDSHLPKKDQLFTLYDTHSSLCFSGANIASRF